MTQHKWHKEIKAWADGAQIECKDESDGIKGWRECVFPIWDEDERVEYRIKTQPKPVQYLYVYFDTYVNRVAFTTEENSTIKTYRFLGKIKLEVGDEPVYST